MGEVRFVGVVERVEDDTSTILMYPEYVEGIYRLGEHQRIWVLYWFHERDNPVYRGVLRVVPHRHGETEERGVFASHSPSRPNPIGLTSVELVKVEGARLTVRGLDAFPGSPVIDIKPAQQ